MKLNSWNTPRPINDGTDRLLSAIDRLYNRLDGIYLQKWKNNFPNPQAVENWKTAWSESMSRAEITFQMAFDGTVRCQEQYPDWPPTLPQFVALCRAPLDYEAAFLEAVAQMHKRQFNEDLWSHPAIYWAAIDFGQFELRNSSYSQAANRWKRLLDKRIASACPSVEPYRAQLTAPARNEAGKAVTSDEAKAMFREAFARLAAHKPHYARTRAYQVLSSMNTK